MIYGIYGCLPSNLTGMLSNSGYYHRRTRNGARVCLGTTSCPVTMTSLAPGLQLFRLFGARALRPARLPHFKLRTPTSSWPRPFSHSTPRLAPQNPSFSLSQRLKDLVKKYGWYAVGVNLCLSATDFSVAFLGVNLLGAEYMTDWMHRVQSHLPSIFQRKEEVESVPAAEPSKGLYAAAVVAFVIHKTIFFPIRTGLTVALTPWLVSSLTKRGWIGAAGAKRAAQEMMKKRRLD